MVPANQAQPIMLSDKIVSASRCPPTPLRDLWLGGNVIVLLVGNDEEDDDTSDDCGDDDDDDHDAERRGTDTQG